MKATQTSYQFSASLTHKRLNIMEMNEVSEWPDERKNFYATEKIREIFSSYLIKREWNLRSKIGMMKRLRKCLIIKLRNFEDLKAFQEILYLSFSLISLVISYALYHSNDPDMLSIDFLYTKKKYIQKVMKWSHENSLKLNINFHPLQKRRMNRGRENKKAFLIVYVHKFAFPMLSFHFFLYCLDATILYFF